MSRFRPHTAKTAGTEAVSFIKVYAYDIKRDE